MTHAWHPREYPAPRNRRSVEGLSEVDEVMRQLCDLLELPLDCPRRACRRSGRCQGGDGPPCFYRKRRFIAGCIETGLRDTRRFWKRQRALARDAQATKDSATSNKRNLSRGAGEAGSEDPARAGNATRADPRPNPLPQAREGDYSG